MQLVHLKIKRTIQKYWAHLFKKEVINYKLYYDSILATLSTMSETNEIKIMFTMIGVMVMLVILCAAAYQLYSSEKYYDSFKETIVHIALTLFDYFLYLFDISVCTVYYKWTIFISFAGYG